MREFKGSKGTWHKDRNNVHTGQIATIHHCVGNDWVEVWSEDWPDTEEKQEANANIIVVAPDMVKFIAELMDEQGDKLKEQESWIYYRAKQILDKALGDE